MNIAIAATMIERLGRPRVVGGRMRSIAPIAEPPRGRPMPNPTSRPAASASGIEPAAPDERAAHDRGERRDDRGDHAAHAGC